MSKKNNMTKLGVWSFIIGLIVAIVLSVFSAEQTPGWSVALLAVLGLIVGFLNVTKEESLAFLVAAIAFLISFQALGAALNVITLGIASKAIVTFFHLMTVFVAPAAAIVAIISLYHISKD